MKTELAADSTTLSSGLPPSMPWKREHAGELGAIAHHWFGVMRKCGDEVRELLHDGCPIACLGDAPFGYVNVFTTDNGQSFRNRIREGLPTIRLRVRGSGLRV